MARLQKMPRLSIDQATLASFGATWAANGGDLSRTPPNSSVQLGSFFERAVADAFAAMVGGVPVVRPNANALIPPQSDCVEYGTIRVIGGVRPQNFDVAYRPDGVRFAFDAKGLNNLKSVAKNWQNMVNDLATEATTVHSRFPHAIVAFLVAIPTPCLAATQQAGITEVLDRLARRVGTEDPLYMAEAIALVVWDPATGEIDANIPDPNLSRLRWDTFHDYVEQAYVSRYKGLPPHVLS